MLNAKGIKFIHDRTRPLDVYTMDRAAKVIAEQVAERAERIDAGKMLKTDLPEVFGRHLAWLIGFDTMIDDREAIHAVTDKLVEENR